jgi:hypothetical protein
MQFTKAASLFTLFFLALVGLVAAGPVKRDVDSSALAVMTTLNSSIASPLSNIGTFMRPAFHFVNADMFYAATIGQNSSATTDDYAPYMQQLNDALNTASSSLATIQSKRAVVERQSDSDVATLVAGIITVRIIVCSLRMMIAYAHALPDF